MVSLVSQNVFRKEKNRNIESSVATTKCSGLGFIHIPIQQSSTDPRSKMNGSKMY